MIIRPVAICLFRNAGRILVFEGHDLVKQETFYRPLGGRIEFGELGHETVTREIREEIGADVDNLRYLWTVENRFVLDGKPGHEIVRIYDGELVDTSLYTRASWIGHEDSGELMTVMWLPVSAFGAERRLFPDGLLDLLVQY